jgi:hypothetical protein
VAYDLEGLGAGARQGSSGTGETPQTQSVEEAHRTPHGKRATWSFNQPYKHFYKATKFAKTAFV